MTRITSIVSHLLSKRFLEGIGKIALNSLISMLIADVNADSIILFFFLLCSGIVYNAPH